MTLTFPDIVLMAGLGALGAAWIVLHKATSVLIETRATMDRNIAIVKLFREAIALMDYGARDEAMDLFREAEQLAKDKD